jgi:hypothetical protein
VGDDQLQGEIPANGAALAVIFSPDSRRVITSDSAGNVYVADPLAPDGFQAWRASEPITALAASPAGDQIAGGGVAGLVEIWGLADGSPVAQPVQFPSAVRSLRFSVDGGSLLVQTASWYHRLNLAGELPALAESRLAPLGAAPQAGNPGPGGRTQRTVVAGRQFEFRDLDMGRPNSPPVTGDVRPVLARWERALGLVLDGAGEARALPLAIPAVSEGNPEFVN